jgi:Fur family transcriptional regulator, ferric uptake regulator
MSQLIGISEPSQHPSGEFRPQDVIRSTGARVTQPRLQVMHILHESNQALSHLDVWNEVCKRSLANEADRVTVYRVLDWLVSEDIAHKIAGQDRVWRFIMNDESGKAHQHHEHAHFVCVDCGKMQCLSEAAAASINRPQLPTGYSFESLEINVRGHCADCLAPKPLPKAKKAKQAAANRAAAK